MPYQYHHAFRQVNQSPILGVIMYSPLPDPLQIIQHRTKENMKPNWKQLVWFILLNQPCLIFVMFMPSPGCRRGLHCIIPWKRVLCYITKRASALITIRIYRNAHFSDIDMPFDMILEALAIISTMCMIQPPANLVNWLTKILVLRDEHSTSYPNILRAINHQCECVVDYWLSKESSLAALWYWNWQCSYSISTANQNRKQTTCRSRSNNVTCLLILTNLEHRHQSILFWLTSIE